MKRSGIGRRGLRPKKTSKREYPADVVNAVYRRSMGACELCRDAPGSEHHHRKLRSRGGADTAANILWLCHSCHHVIVHGHVSWATNHGLLVPSWANEETIDPVRGCGLDCFEDHTA